MKIMRYLISYFLVPLFLSSCANIRLPSIDEHIGLYEVVDSKCEVEEGSFDHCKNTLFIEIVRGQFIGIKDTELAYVFWSGHPEIDPELQYTSHLLNGVIERNTSSSDKLWINKNENTEEYFHIDNGRITKYYVIYISGDNNKTRNIKYTLKPVMRGDLPFVRLNYPGNK